MTIDLSKSLFGELEKNAATEVNRQNASGYEAGISGGQEYAEYRLGQIKDVYKNQPTLHLAIAEYRKGRIAKKQRLGFMYLDAYLTKGDPQALLAFQENESSLNIEREKQVVEDWATEVRKSPYASEAEKNIARGIFAKQLKPYGIETELAQLVQYQAGAQSSDLTYKQGSSMGLGNETSEYAKISADIAFRKNQMEQEQATTLLTTLMTNENKMDPDRVKEVSNFLKNKIPGLKSASGGEFND